MYLYMIHDTLYLYHTCVLVRTKKIKFYIGGIVGLFSRSTFMYLWKHNIMCVVYIHEDFTCMYVNLLSHFFPHKFANNLLAPFTADPATAPTFFVTNLAAPPTFFFTLSTLPIPPLPCATEGSAPSRQLGNANVTNTPASHPTATNSSVGHKDKECTAKPPVV